jgi:hypothetical protein
MPAGRRCADPDCITPLSRYNASDHCWVHGGWPQTEVRRGHQDDMHEALMEMAA